VVSHGNIYALSRSSNDVWVAQSKLEVLPKKRVVGLLWRKIANVPGSIHGFSIVVPVNNFLVAIASKPCICAVHRYDIVMDKWECMRSIPALLYCALPSAEPQGIIAHAPGNDHIYILTLNGVVRYEVLKDQHTTLGLQSLQSARSPVALGDLCCIHSRATIVDNHIEWIRQDYATLITELEEVLRVGKDTTTYAKIASLHMGSADLLYDTNKWMF